jgi:hypothetical protein
MKNTLTSMLTLVIMIIGLALIIGGPGAVRFLFAPFLSGIRVVVRVCFVALIVLVLVAALFSRRSAPQRTYGSSATPPQNEVRERVEAGVAAR